MYILGKPHTNFQLNLQSWMDASVIFKYNVKTTCIPHSVNNNRHI